MGVKKPKEKRVHSRSTDGPYTELLTNGGRELVERSRGEHTSIIKKKTASRGPFSFFFIN